MGRELGRCRSSRRASWTARALVLLCQVAGSAWAEEGRIPIYEPVSIAGGAVAGKYVVTRDIVGTGAAAAISFTGTTGTESVELDLNGFTIRHATGGSVPIVDANNLGKFTIRNGSILGNGRTGILVRQTAQAIVEDVSITNSGTGISMDAPNQFAIRRALVDTATVYGIVVNGASGVDNTGTIENCLVRRTGADGIRLWSAIDGATVQDNRVRDAGLSVTAIGIYVDTGGGSDVDDILEVRFNSVRNINGEGLWVGGNGACTIEGNRVGGSSGSGIRVQADGCLIEDNVARLNDEAGLRVSGDRNQIEGNVITDNGLGLWLVPSSCGTTGNCGNENTFGKNTARGNVGTGASCVAPAPGSCSSPDLCIDPTTGGNDSFGDNLMPGGC